MLSYFLHTDSMKWPVHCRLLWVIFIWEINYCSSGWLLVCGDGSHLFSVHSQIWGRFCVLPLLEIFFSLGLFVLWLHENSQCYRQLISHCCSCGVVNNYWHTQEHKAHMNTTGTHIDTHTGTHTYIGVHTQLHINSQRHIHRHTRHTQRHTMGTHIHIITLDFLRALLIFKRKQEMESRDAFKGRFSHASDNSSWKAL